MTITVQGSNVILEASENEDKVIRFHNPKLFSPPRKQVHLDGNSKKNKTVTLEAPVPGQSDYDEYLPASAAAPGVPTQPTITVDSKSYVYSNPGGPIIVI